MANSSLAPPLDNNDDTTEIINDLDKMIENMDLISGGATPPPLYYYSLPFCVYATGRGFTAVSCVHL